MTTARRRLTLTSIMAVLMAVLVVATASAAQFRGTYAVRSITLTYTTKVITTQARLSDGTTGTMTVALTARLVSKKPGAASGLQSPEVANQFICSPGCPRFAAGGTVGFQQNFTPSGGGAPTSCKATKTIPKATTGTVYVTSAKTGRATLVFKVSDAKGPNDLYVLVRGACALPILAPVDSYDYSAFGTRSVKTSVLGAKTIVLSFTNTLKPPTYPWPATGATKATAVVVLERKR
jgi:hypothetical protein